MPSSSYKLCISSGMKDVSSGGKILNIRCARGERPFLISNGAVMEFTRVSPAVSAPSSWLAGETVIADGSILTVSPVDVIFFLLPLLEVGDARWSSAGQLLVGDSSGTCLAEIDGVWDRIAAVCDTYDPGEKVEANTLVRLNHEKTTKLLATKVRRVAAALHATTRARAGARAQSAASASSFVDNSYSAPRSTNFSPVTTDLTSEPPAAELAHAVSIIAEYLSDSWMTKLSVELGLTRGAAAELSTSAVETPAGGAAVSRASEWNNSATDDPYDAIAKYVKGQKLSDSGKKAAAPAAKTPVNGKLAAVKSKNVQKIGSFFSAAKKV